MRCVPGSGQYLPPAAIAALLLLTPVRGAAAPIAFDFGITPTLTVTQNVDVVIPAAVINRSADTLVFGCTLASCGGLDFGASVTAPLGEGLGALQFMFLDPRGSSFYQQFVGLRLEPDQRFDFLFGTVNFDPSIVNGNPFGTVLHPTFGFRIEDAFAFVLLTVHAGDQTSFAPLSFQPSTSPVVPEPGTIVLLATGTAGLLAKKRKPA